MTTDSQSFLDKWCSFPWVEPSPLSTAQAQKRILAACDEAAAV
jgi:hypothetical protein